MAAGGGEQKASVGTPTVFISYASQDADAANSIVENLEQHRLVTTWSHVRAQSAGGTRAEVPKFTLSTRKVQRPLTCVES